MTALDTALLVAVALLLAATTYLAAVETVVSRLNVVRALRLAEEEARGARALLWLTEHRATTLNVLLLMTVVVRVGVSAASTLLGLRLGTGALPVVGALVAVALLSLVLGEVAPRTLVLRHLERTGLALAGSARAVVRAADPVAKVIVSLGRALVPRRDEVSGPYASDDELRALEVDEEEQDDELEPEERAMIRSIFELADTLVREVMTPRPDMVTVPTDAPLDTVVHTVLDRGYSRLPVHDPDDTDTILGVVHAKDVLRQLAVGPDAGPDAGTGWYGLVRDPTFVPETKRCDELLRDLQAAAVHLALVVDEYGELVGLATIEDILEEIVGDIIDEHDREEPLVVPQEDGALRVDARLGVDDLNELLSAALPEEGWDTVGGLVFGTLGRVPVEGDTVELDGTTITVEQVQGRRVGKVLVRNRSTDGSTDGSDDGPDEGAHEADEPTLDGSGDGPARTSGTPPTIGGPGSHGSSPAEDPVAGPEPAPDAGARPRRSRKAPRDEARHPS